MRIEEVKERTGELMEQLTEVWENSVRASHMFLSDGEIREIRRYVPEALEKVPVLVIAEDDCGIPVGFMGIAGTKLEMLFISDEKRGQGAGKKMLIYGIEKYSIMELAVNEQNPAAKKFYEYMGFKVTGRTELDEQGNPYPLLYMRRG